MIIIQRSVKNVAIKTVTGKKSVTQTVSDIKPATEKNIEKESETKNITSKNQTIKQTIKETTIRNDILKEAAIRRGDIYYADLSPVVGSEQGGLRPVLIVQNDVGNKFSPTVIAAAITSRHAKNNLPTHIPVNGVSCGLSKDSIVLLEQIRTIDKKRLKEKIGHLDDILMKRVDDAITISFGLTDI